MTIMITAITIAVILIILTRVVIMIRTCFFDSPKMEKIKTKNTKVSVNYAKWTFIVPNFHKIESIQIKIDIFYQTNEFESTIGTKYYFAKLLFLEAPDLEKRLNGFVY